MSNSGKFMDSTPFIRSAGITTAIIGDNTDVCIRQTVHQKVRPFVNAFRLEFRPPRSLRGIGSSRESNLELNKSIMVFITTPGNMKIISMVLRPLRVIMLTIVSLEEI
jgi:hypothetical protein